jgi:hypothetical protein
MARILPQKGTAGCYEFITVENFSALAFGNPWSRQDGGKETASEKRRRLRKRSDAQHRDAARHGGQSA